ncbi:signal recognition particle-docking protein FtsY [Pseudooceanicola onchidii]|uniref:signal recognition particle-docking protein FtsY n=1 Tax=Pseudooceanicola onchidii TaxID=2562279 RepID=UPI0010AB288E|nr:signal recognition particle-docking protein FtsY [Pseudooceanicola onchidii]
MAFFSKLKDRLFKSSSKLEEGLDAIVADGGHEEPAETPDVPPPPTETPPTPEPELPPQPDPAPSPTPEETPQPDLPEPELPQPDAEPVPDAPTILPSPGPEEVPASPPDMVPAPRPDPAPTPEPDPIPAPPNEAPDTDLPEENRGAARDGGILSRLFTRKDSAPVVRRVLDDDMLEQLEELLIASDMGVDTALRVASNMAEGRMGRRLSTTEIKGLLADEVTRIMEPVAKPLPLFPKKPQVVLVVGVNGSGKTTTVGKLASQFRGAGKSVIIAAGDTFRAAAVEQLEIWGQRAGVPVLKAAEGSDPAALAFDALQKAEAEGADLLMIDTAGRLQNRADLMEELAKIIRVLRKKDPSAPHNTLLVLDATTGQNALSQVETFRKMADVSGLVMTKLDGTAKGGVLVALADKFGLPIHAIGVGEQIDDLAPFDPDDFARALTGADS